MPVLPGMPVMTLRTSPERTRGLIHCTALRIGRDGRVDEQALERMVEVPVIDDVLEVPDDLARVRVDRERRVVVEVLLVVAAEHELRRRRRDRRADVQAVQLGIVARHHPRADVPALLVRACRPRFRRRARPASGSCAVRHVSLPVFGVERRDHACLGSAFGLAAAPRDDLAVRDDRARAVLRALAVVEDERLPGELARARVERVCVTVGPVVENQVDRRSRDCDWSGTRADTRRRPRARAADTPKGNRPSLRRGPA